MSRHRDVRTMNYSDDYDGYDDVYGTSADDDYCTSPSAEQFMYDRNKQANIASFITEPDIEEDVEEEEAENISSSYKLPQLSELEATKLMSCMELIKNAVGDVYPESELNKKIMEFNFDAEKALDSLLNDGLLNKDKSTAKKNLAAAQTGGTNGKQPAASTATITVGQAAAAASAAMPAPKPTVRVVPAASKVIVKGFDLSAAEGSDQQLSASRSQSPSSDRLTPDLAAAGSREDATKGSGRQTTAQALRSETPSPRSRSPAIPSAAATAEERRDALAIYKSKRAGGKDQLHLITVGHVDAGKSTLLGRLLCDQGEVPAKLMHKYQQESKKIGKQSFAYAWVLDETGEERERGITMDVGHSKFETPTKSITLLDAPGHRDFIPNMITGSTQADAALLVVDATRGEFETGFDSGGQTREHALLLRSLGVSQLAVVVNKLDTVDWSKGRFDEIVNKLSVFLKQAGFRDSLAFVPCSGLSGENIVAKPKAEGLASWYTGPTLIEVIDNFKCPERPVDKPFRFSVNDIFKNVGSGFSISGHMETGMISIGDKVVILPHNESGVVKSIYIDESPVTHAFAGDTASLNLPTIDQQNIAIGDIACSPYHPIPVTTRFQAHVVVFAIKVPITNGMPVVLHQQSLVEPATITRLVAQLNRSSGEVIKKRPRCLPKNSSAIIEVTTQSPICVELHKDVKQLGRVTLRIDGATVAAGVVTKIK